MLRALLGVGRRARPSRSCATSGSRGRFSAALVGGALALSGAALQALLGNPLADPYLLGVSGGAACGTLVGALLGLGARGRASGAARSRCPLAAFLGALAAVLVVGLGRLRPAAGSTAGGSSSRASS